MAVIKWTKADKIRVRTVLKRLAKAAGGWQGIADKLEMKAKSSRATVESWSRRGRVSLIHVHAICKLAAEHDPDIKVSPSGLNPQAKLLEKGQ